MNTAGWKPDKQAGIPIYQQIVGYISNKIACGDLIIGDRLPSQRELAKEFAVNRSTIVEAMDELKAMGLIQGCHTLGTRIINNTWSSLLSKRSLNWKQYITGGIHERNLPAVQAINQSEFDAEVIRLGTGELSPEMFPKQMFDHILKQLPARILSLNYLEPKGLLELREALSCYLKSFGISVPASGILIVSGALQALQLISVGILQSGSRVYVETPSYLKSLQIFQSSGMQLQGIEMDREGILPWMMNASGSNPTELLYTIPTFHNPTGITMTEKRREELLNWCMSRHMPVIEDDCYHELWIDNEPPLPLKSKDSNGMVLYLGSISKSLAPGLRIGWLVGPESIIEHLSDIKMQMDYGASSVSQWILTEWLTSGLYQEYLGELRKQLRKRRDLTINLLEKYMGEYATWQKPAGGFYIWVKLKHRLSADKLFSEALKKHVLFNPGSIYDNSKSEYLRLSYSYASEKQLAEGISILSELVKKGI